MDLYFYSTFLVLMTTQSSLQYSFTFTQSHTHSYSASISSTLLFYEGQFRVQHLAQGHFGMPTFLERLGIEQVGGRPLSPLSHSRPLTQWLSRWHFVLSSQMTMGSCRATCFLEPYCWCIAGMWHPQSWQGNYWWYIQLLAKYCNFLCNHIPLTICYNIAC